MDRGKIGKTELVVTLSFSFCVLLGLCLVLSTGNVLALFIFLEVIIVLVLTFVPLLVRYRSEFTRFIHALIFQKELYRQGPSFLKITETGSRYAFRSGVAAFGTGLLLSLIAFDAP